MVALETHPVRVRMPRTRSHSRRLHRLHEENACATLTHMHELAQQPPVPATIVSTSVTDDTRFVNASCEMTYITDGTTYKDFREKITKDISQNSGKELLMMNITLKPFDIGKIQYQDGQVQFIKRGGGVCAENIGVSYDKRSARPMKTNKRKGQSELVIRWDGKDPNKRPRYLFV